MSQLSKFVNEIVANAVIIKNCSLDELKELSRKDEIKTEYGSSCYLSKVLSRSAKKTEIINGQLSEKNQETLRRVANILKGKKLIQTDAAIATGKRSIPCRIYIPEEYARIAYIWKTLLFESKEKKPKIVLLFVPGWPEISVLVDINSYITVGLGIDYAGEAKMSSLRLAMYYAKQKGGLGLHAGSKVLMLKKGPKGEIKEKGILLFGLSATGKTTLTCHTHRLDIKKGEGIKIKQDDISFLWKYGSCSGTEKNFYIKTEGIDNVSQPMIYEALTRKNTILENVYVKNGHVDFQNYELTTNGRAVIERELLPFTDKSIDMKKVDVVLFITRRNTIVPPIAKLNNEHATTFFMLGESIETSAGDPKHAGEPVHV